MVYLQRFTRFVLFLLNQIVETLKSLGGRCLGEGVALQEWTGGKKRRLGRLRGCKEMGD